jgi:hypothetical protein
LPTTYTLNGFNFTGAALRYARTLPDGRGCAGQGVEAVTGIVSFVFPTTFDLTREPDGAVMLITDHYPYFERNWIAENSKVDVRTLTGGWEPIADFSQGSHLAQQRRTGRQLVTYRFH